MVDRAILTTILLENQNKQSFSRILMVNNIPLSPRITSPSTESYFSQHNSGRVRILKCSMLGEVK
jgi:hypothetical protein